MTDQLEPDLIAKQFALDGLHELHPELNASRTASRGQVVVLCLLAAAIVFGLIFATVPTAIVLVAIATVAYTVTIVDRVLLFRSGLRVSRALHVTDEDALAYSEDDLPTYTILVPAFHESNIIATLVDHLGALDYPEEKIQILLLLEESDPETVRLALAADRPDYLDIVVVPDCHPQTKPKACNYGLSFATGELVTIYDAEDRPEPLQLRRVAVAFTRIPETVACIQARLRYHNASQNLLTRWFTLEYDQWFGFMLPGLMTRRTPIPLGGTSNHMWTDVLRSVGGWDPYNVTEDADLGIRLAHHGYDTAVIDSITLEEANSDPINWVRQRSRWNKGYLMTFLVHTRDLRGLYKSIGVTGILGMTVILAGIPLLGFLNLVFWMLTLLWIFGRPPIYKEIFVGPLYLAPLALLVVGNAAIIYVGVASARHEGQDHLVWAALFAPLYWVLMAFGSLKAIWQLITKPSYWEKTAHGLDDDEKARGE